MRRAGAVRGTELVGGAPWLPPAEEWDFRAVDPGECAIACYWEYSRTLPEFSKDPKSWVHNVDVRRISPFYAFMLRDEGEQPQPWTSMDATERGMICGCVSKSCPLTVRPLKDLIAESLRMMKGNHKKALEMMSSYGLQVLNADFPRHGSEAVIEAFKAWARAEFKKCPRTLRGKAAGPPFDCLKWLSAWRLESARRSAGRKIEEVQRALSEYQRQVPAKNYADVLPVYATRGGWSKAVGDAERLLLVEEADPMALVCKLVDPAFWELKNFPRAAERLARVSRRRR
jgi:hypothetical protein